MEVISYSVIYKSLLGFWLTLSLVTEDHIIIPSSLHLYVYHYHNYSGCKLHHWHTLELLDDSSSPIFINGLPFSALSFLDLFSSSLWLCSSFSCAAALSALIFSNSRCNSNSSSSSSSLEKTTKQQNP